MNVNKNVNVNVDHHGGYHDYHPLARGMAVAAGAAVASAIIGSVVYSLPPSCSVVQLDGITYQQCGSTWYQPRYAGSQVTYIVVNSPD